MDLENGTAEKSRKKSNPSIVTRSPVMQALLAMAKRIAPSGATVLIEGESGTGKELLARYIHEHSGRGRCPMLAMNCAALPDNLAESELFGYERGAFTGAAQRRIGKFERAHEGTLLLDEISEMPLALQAKLLRVLQEKEVDRIGGEQPIAIDVRVIATTNRDLTQMVKEGSFRQDLYYRLKVVPLTIPPLRARPEDIAALIDHFVRKHHLESDGDLPCFDADAMQKMILWQWPGNVRELENTIQRALLIRGGSSMGPELLLLEEDMAGTGTVSPAAAQLVGMTVKALEERLIAQTLQHVNQNRTHAAEMLGISIRTLRNKLREYRQGET
jgi:two-component system, response regulator FlrC